MVVLVVVDVLVLLVLVVVVVKSDVQSVHSASISQSISAPSPRIYPHNLQSNSEGIAPAMNSKSPQQSFNPE